LNLVGSNHAATGRILALDFGKRRIGLAISDPSRLIASTLETLQRTTIRADLDALRDLAATREATLILIGLPLNMNGSEGLPAQRVREFAERLGRRTGLAVELWDERLTSVAAEEMLRERGANPDRRSGKVDALAAAILLQGYLDHQRGGEESLQAWPGEE
jgi:putative Holliday junction resolvase